MKKCINQLQMRLLNYLNSGKWHYDYSASFLTYLFCSEKLIVRGSRWFLRHQSWCQNISQRSPNTSEQQTKFTNFVNIFIIYDHHAWSEDHIWWWSYMMIIYDDHIWWSCTMIIYNAHIWWSYMMIIYDVFLVNI